MNIDVINKHIANTQNLKEADVKLINSFYWGGVKQHLYNCDPQPLHIDYLCVLHPDKRLIKKAILKYIQRIRNIRKSKKFNAGSVKSRQYIGWYSNYVRMFYNLRKQHKFTN